MLTWRTKSEKSLEISFPISSPNGSTDRALWPSVVCGTQPRRPPLPPRRRPLPVPRPLPRRHQPPQRQRIRGCDASQDAPHPVGIERAEPDAAVVSDAFGGWPPFLVVDRLPGVPSPRLRPAQPHCGAELSSPNRFSCVGSSISCRELPGGLLWWWGMPPVREKGWWTGTWARAQKQQKCVCWSCWNKV
jgi:hypothetical protein